MWLKYDAYHCNMVNIGSIFIGRIFFGGRTRKVQSSQSNLKSCFMFVDFSCWCFLGLVPKLDEVDLSDSWVHCCFGVWPLKKGVACLWNELGRCSS